MERVVTDVSSVGQDYLKVIWSAREWAPEDPVSTKMLAERMGVSASTASEAIRRLADQGLVSHAPYRSIELTEEGERVALAMVRRHRLIETFLVRDLGYGWEEAHPDAEILEHAASDQLIARIDEKLEHPTRNPHGDPIPAADGTVIRPIARRLSDLAAGSVGLVARIADENPDMLRYFASVGLELDARVEVAERRDFAGVIVCLVGDSRRDVELGSLAADAVWLATL
jgi:DtxR family Mn-dependent transcriptional regulator